MYSLWSSGCSLEFYTIKEAEHFNSYAQNCAHPLARALSFGMTAYFWHERKSRPRAERVRAWELVIPCSRAMQKPFCSVFVFAKGLSVIPCIVRGIFIEVFSRDLHCPAD